MKYKKNAQPLPIRVFILVLRTIKGKSREQSQDTYTVYVNMVQGCYCLTVYFLPYKAHVQG